MRLSFFRTPKPRRYNYIPQYFDPKQEELDRRMQAMESQASDQDAIRYRITSGLKNKYQHDANSSRSGQVRQSNMILIGVIISLLGIGYVLLDSSVLGEWLLGVYGG